MVVCNLQCYEHGMDTPLVSFTHNVIEPHKYLSVLRNAWVTQFIGMRLLSTPPLYC